MVMSLPLNVLTSIVIAASWHILFVYIDEKDYGKKDSSNERVLVLKPIISHKHCHKMSLSK